MFLIIVFTLKLALFLICSYTLSKIKPQVFKELLNKKSGITYIGKSCSSSKSSYYEINTARNVIQYQTIVWSDDTFVKHQQQPSKAASFRGTQHHAGHYIERQTAIKKHHTF